MKKILGMMSILAFAMSASVNAECTGNEAMKVSCKNGKVKIKLTGAEVGATATFEVTTDSGTLTAEATVKDNGKAKVKIKDVEDEDGLITVTYVECELSEEVECG